MVQIPWPKKAQLLRLPQGVFMGVSPFMTLLQRGDTDVRPDKEEQGVCREFLLDNRLFTPDLL